MSKRRRLLALALALGACTETGPGPNTPLVLLGKAGSNQVAPPGTTLPNQIAVQVGRGSTPQPDVFVRFSTFEGVITPATGTTNADGIFSASWTLPAGSTPRFVRGTAAIDSGPAVPFTAFVVPASHAVISLTNNEFMPVPRSIAAGGTVTWVWYDDADGHNVTPVGLEPVRSGNLSDGPLVYSYAFPTSGNYTFYCEAHGTPGGTGMAGVVVVSAP